MPDHVETELKLDLPEDALRKLEKLGHSAGARRRPQHLDSVYFDTRKFKLHRHGLSLRVRSDGEHRIQTIKSAGDGRGLAERNEWETPVENPRPNLHAVDGTALEPFASKRLGRSLQPIFATVVKRQVFAVRAGDAELEVALDKGEIRSRKRTAAICEAEVELKKGQPSDLYDFVRRLSKEVPLCLSVQSKAERGYRLADGRDTEPFHANDMRLGRSATAGDAFRAIGTACLRQIGGNWKLVSKGDAEGIHAMRVGLRRLRAAISLFSGMLADAQTQAMKNEFKWLTGELGHARQLQVFETNVLDPLRKTQPGVGTSQLADALNEHRSDALERARAAVLSPRFRVLLLDAAEWLDTGHWCKASDELKSAVRGRPAADYARDELTRRHHKIIKRGRHLRELGERPRHKLRIAAKKLRYGTEFFGCLFSSSEAIKRRKTFLRALKELQDVLGELNDIAAHQKLCASLADEASGARSESKLAFVAGVAHGWEDRREKPALCASEKAYRLFRKVGRPFT